MTTNNDMCTQCTTKKAGLTNPATWNFQGLCHSCWSRPYRIHKTKDVIHMFNKETKKEGVNV